MLRKDKFEMKLLSVVVPAYKQEDTIIRDIKNIESSLKELSYNYEIIIVVDGLVDETYKKVLKLKSSRIKILGYKKNQGKGHALRYGMMQANGDIIGFIDAGMDIHPNGFSMLLNHMQWYNADIITGSKLHPVSKVTGYPWFRVVFSWGYRVLTATLFGFKISDTQVGLKFFKRKVIRDVLPRLLVKNYAFDVEILAVAHNLGYKRIFEAPVEIMFQQKKSSITSSNFWKIIYSMLWDTFAVYYRVKILQYYSKK